MHNFKNTERIIELNQINSPFVEDINRYRSKSRNTRKKIYKYLQANHHNHARQTTKTIKVHLQQKKLPQQLQLIQNVEIKGLATLQILTFPKEMRMQLIRNLVSQQENQILSITGHSFSTFKTAHKRRPLTDITLVQSIDKNRLLLTNQNQESPRLSLEGDFCSEVSIFNGFDNQPQQKSQDQLESLKLKENYSILQIQNRFSNISNSLFEEPAHGDVLSFN